MHNLEVGSMSSNAKSLDDLNAQNHELNSDELDSISGGFGFGIEIKDLGGLIAQGIGAVKEAVDTADDWAHSGRGPNILGHIGNVKIGM